MVAPAIGSVPFRLGKLGTNAKRLAFGARWTRRQFALPATMRTYADRIAPNLYRYDANTYTTGGLLPVRIGRARAVLPFNSTTFGDDPELIIPPIT